MDHDMAQKKRHRKSSSPPRSAQSKFFHTSSGSKACGVQRRHSDGVISVASSSKLQDKENLYIVVDDEEAAETSEPDLDGSDLSLKAQYDHDIDIDLHVDEFPDVVEQEEGYISPTPSCSNDLQDLSSPLRPGQTPARGKWKSDQMDDSAMIHSDEEAYFGVEAVSSPVSTVKRRPSPFVGRGFIQETPTKRNANNDDDGCILVHATPSPTRVQYPVDEIPSPILYYGPDLRNALALAADDDATDLGYMKADPQKLRRKHSCPESRYNSTSPPSPSPDTSDGVVPRARQQISERINAVIDVDASDYDLDEEDAEQARANASRTKVVMSGWRDRWAVTSKTKKTVHAQQVPADEGSTRGAVPQTLLNPKNQCIPGSRTANLKRSDTNVTPQGRHAFFSASKHPRSAPSRIVGGGMKPINAKGLGKARRSILFVNQTTKPSAHGRDGRCREIVDTNGEGIVSGQLDDIAMRAQERLSMFR
ncbi:hypothetical protein BYT27DRAFT_6428173 [Phlegmacium glaucopus]|nr:hypothetical protein BYT27DRAFT_6428173 [Phlegmacium glaucopus]